MAAADSTGGGTWRPVQLCGGNPALLCDRRALSGKFLRGTRRIERKSGCRGWRCRVRPGALCAAARTGTDGPIRAIPFGGRTERSGSASGSCARVAPRWRRFTFPIADRFLERDRDWDAAAFLQPYAAGIRSRSNMRWSGPTPYLCPFCKRKPGLGVLRPLGDGAQRSLVCSFCLAEWEFRRIVCPGCGEENPTKLPVYTAEELKHVRVEGCDSCRSYIKTVDMTKSGLAEPIVDEMAAIPLDLWAQKQGYTKLQTNLMQL